jgi:hypothetical protein
MEWKKNNIINTYFYWAIIANKKKRAKTKVWPPVPGHARTLFFAAHISGWNPSGQPEMGKAARFDNSIAYGCV